MKQRWEMEWPERSRCTDGSKDSQETGTADTACLLQCSSSMFFSILGRPRSVLKGTKLCWKELPLQTGLVGPAEGNRANKTVADQYLSMVWCRLGLDQSCDWLERGLVNGQEVSVKSIDKTSWSLANGYTSYVHRRQECSIKPELDADFMHNS